MRYEDFQKLNAEVLSISVDSIYSHKVWNEIDLSQMVPGGIPFPMLQDRNGKIGSAYNCYDENKGCNFRTTVIIDGYGYIKALETIDPAVGRNIAEVHRLLKALQHNQWTKELTPADWMPGKKTIIKTPALVGNISETWQVETGPLQAH